LSCGQNIESWLKEALTDSKAAFCTHQYSFARIKCTTALIKKKIAQKNAATGTHTETNGNIHTIPISFATILFSKETERRR